MIRFSGALLITLLVSGCATTGWRSRAGIGYYGQATRVSVAAAEIPGSKRGDACAYNILSLVSIGDASIVKAKENGSIKRVATLDFDYVNLFWSVGRFCAVITGE